MSRPQQPQQPQPEQQPAPQQQTRPKVQPWRNPPAAVLLPADEGGQAGPQQMRRSGHSRQYALASGWIAPNNVFHPLAEGEYHGDFAARHLGHSDPMKAFSELHKTGWIRVAAPGHFGNTGWHITTGTLKRSGVKDRIADFLYGLKPGEPVHVGDENWQSIRGGAHEVVGKLFGNPERMARVPMTAQPAAQPAHWRAPAGGEVVKGTYYQGGKLIPAEGAGIKVKPKTRKMPGLLKELRNALAIKYAREHTPDDEAFRHAVDENAHDDAPKLVYADWLDEHGRESEANIWREMTQEKGDEDLHPKGWMVEAEDPTMNQENPPPYGTKIDRLFDELTTGRRHREFPAHTHYIGRGSASRRIAYVSSPTTPENQNRTATYLEWADRQAGRAISHLNPVVAVRTSPRQNRHPLVNAAIGAIPRGFGPVGIQHIATAHGDYLAGKPTALADLMHRIRDGSRTQSQENS